MATNKKKVTVDVKYAVKGADAVEGAFDGVADSANEAADATGKLSDNTAGLKGAFGAAKQGAGGLLTSFKALITNPIGAVITAVVAAVQALKSAFDSNEEASNKLGQGWAYLKGLLKPLKDAFFAVFDAITFAIEKPGEAWDSIVETFESGFNYLDRNVWGPMKAGFTLLVGQIEAGILRMRIGWNNLTGDAEEAQALTDELKIVEKEIAEAYKIIEDAQKEMTEDFNNAVDAIVEAQEAALAYADAMVELENREQALVRARREQEVQNAKSLAQLESLKVIRDDESKSLEERIAANEKIAKIEANRVNQALSLTQKELQLLKDRAALEGEGTEILDAITEKEIELAELRNENAGIRAEQITNEVNLRKEQFDKEAALIENELNKNSILEEDAVKLADAKIEAERKKLEALKQLKLEENQIFLDQQNALDIAILEAEKARRDQQKEIAEQEAKDKEEQDKKDLEAAKKLAKEKEEIEKEYQENKAAIIEGGFELANSFAKEGSKEAEAIQKAAALTQIGIDTAQAISSLVAASEANPANAVTFGAAGIAQFAAGAIRIATNIAQAAKLLKAPAPDVESGGNAGTSPSAPSPDVNTDIGFNGVSAGAERFGAPVRAYVTEAEITQTQNNINNIQNLSELN